MDGQLESLAEPLNGIRAGAYFVSGNYETYLGVENSLEALKKTSVQVLDDAMVNIFN
jgi:hypothetical protein